MRASDKSDALRKVPLDDRLATLCVSIVHEEPHAAFALMTLIQVARMLAKHLPIAEQTQIRWHLQNAIEELQARWH
jgi:hypothetical protein